MQTWMMQICSCPQRNCCCFIQGCTVKEIRITRWKVSWRGESSEHFHPKQLKFICRDGSFEEKTTIFRAYVSLQTGYFLYFIGWCTTYHIGTKSSLPNLKGILVNATYNTPGEFSMSNILAQEDNLDSSVVEYKTGILRKAGSTPLRVS